MADYLFLMHDDGAAAEAAAWGPYLAKLGTHLQGGSAIGGGACLRKSGAVPPLTPGLSGYIRVTADDIGHARRLLEGNPVFEAGGTVEIRELPRT